MLTIAVLGVLGLCFGSFVQALSWRVHEQSKTKKSKKTLSVIHGRSQCENCGHKLATLDLVPLLSWLFLRGHCRYCKKPIHWSVPFIEVAMALVFVLSYWLWPESLAGGQWLLLGTWLVCSVGLLALTVYDIRFMLLPNRILYPTFFVALVGRLGYIIFFSPKPAHDLLFLVLAVAVASGLFWILYQVSKGQWIGFGDVRLGLITGTLLATPAKSFIMIFLASILGTLFVAPALINGRKHLTAKLPFGPFLIVATFITMLVGQAMLDWYQGFLL